MVVQPRSERLRQEQASEEVYGMIQISLERTINRLIAAPRDVALHVIYHTAHTSFGSDYMSSTPFETSIASGQCI